MTKKTRNQGRANTNARPLSKQQQAIFQQAIHLQQQGQLDLAEALYQELLATQPKHFDSLHLLGLIYLQTNRLELGIERITEALSINRSYAPAFNNRANAYKELNRINEALQDIAVALKLDPTYADAHYNLGIMLQSQQRYDEAIQSYQRAIAIHPTNAQAHYNQGLSAQALLRLEEAVRSYDAAITIYPEYAQAYNNRGNALIDLRQLDAAIVSLETAIKINPSYAEAYVNLSAAYKELDRLDLALQSAQQAIALNNQNVDAHNNEGAMFVALNQFDQAIASFDRALRLKPDFDFLLGTYLHTKMQGINWHGLEVVHQEVCKKILLQQKVTPPFPVLSVTDSPRVQQLAAEIHIAEKHPLNAALGLIQSWPRHARIRVAYLSSDFQESPAGYNMVGFFEAHDRTRFETYAVSFGPDVDSPLRQRLKGAFAHFLEVRNLSDLDIARQLRALQIDIAVDIQGPTQNERGGIFALRCASIQVNNFGWTSGAPYMDYIIADPVVLPPEHETFYTEKVVRLPHTFFATDNKKIIAEYTPTRSEAGLPETGFVFCAFNNSYKITPPVFDCWMRILKQVPESVLWLREKNPTTAENLKKEAKARGVDAARLIFAPRTESMADHLARHRLADLFLDNFPFGAQTTASDALWAGLPIVTRTGEAMMSRVAASLLTAVGLPELITTNEADYEALVLELATHPDKLKAIRDKLARNRLTTPLFNTEDYATHFQKAYLAMLDA